MKRQDLAAFHRERIVQAAANLFQEKGVEATTVDEIARAADYSKATLYVYFEGKEEIFRYVQRDAMAYMESATAAIAEREGDPIAQYRGLCENLLDYSRSHPFHFASMLETIPFGAESRKASPVLEEIYQIGERINGDIQKMIEGGIRKGLFREEAGQQPVGMLYWAMLSGAVNLSRQKQAYIQEHANMDEEDFLHFAFDTMLRALLK